MKKRPLLSASILIFCIIAVYSCKKELTTDPNQIYIDQLKIVTDSIIQNTTVPGIVAIVVDHQRGINWLYAAGVSDKETQAPMDSSYTFRIASNTKTFTATVLLQLVDEGKLTLNDKLSKYFPDYPKSDSITIAMLLNMTSGIFDYFYDEQFLSSYLIDPLKVYSPQELAAIGFANPFSFNPGAGWAYSNTNYILLGMIIEKITGNTVGEEINNRILLPMQLTQTGYLNTGTDFPGPHARGYYFPDVNNYGDMTAPYDISRAGAAGSMYSTPREMQKYVEQLVGGGFLSDTLQNRRLNEMQYVGGLFGNYGLGLLKNGSFYGHGGTLWGFTSVIFHSNVHNCTIIIYFNCDLETTIHPLYLFQRYANILYGIDF
jgi:D-alanyl-D-alanine carboxypeptidase